MPPMTIGLPVARFPLPRPQTLFVLDPLPLPTGVGADTALAANAATSSARTQLLASATLSFLDRMRTLLGLALLR